MVGRNGNGQFAKGNKAAKGHNGKNAGRPPEALRAEMAAVMEGRLPLSSVVDRLAQRIEGDNCSTDDIRLWFQYLIGLPVQRNENKNDDTVTVIIKHVRHNPGSTRAAPGAGAGEG